MSYTGAGRAATKSRYQKYIGVVINGLASAKDATPRLCTAKFSDKYLEGKAVKHYELLLNKTAVCRPWPLLPAAQADDEIAKLRAHVSQLREENKSLRSLAKSLILANEELRVVIKKAVKK
jgi:hypothetical protein